MPQRVSADDARCPFGTVVVTSVSGPATDRTYQGYIVVPQCGFAEQSTWSDRSPR